ncbi:MAG: hypothetical protein FD180_4415 [Planctomycetota bacterium]|nr:MAG: hypothetical protein FD180_4415 [Planctomycetota bacterium]
MNRSEGAVAFAVMAGTMFLISIMGPLFAWAFKPEGHDPLMLAGVALVGLGNSASLYGISTILRALAQSPSVAAAARPAAASAPDDPRAELMGASADGAGKAFASPGELMSSVRTLIELENWKLAHQRAFELVEAYPQSEEAAKVKKNLDYLQKKASG